MDDTGGSCSIFSIFGMANPAPIVGATLVSNDDPPERQPEDVRCVYFSKLREKWYVRIYKKGKRHQKAFFSTAEEAAVARDKLEAELKAQDKEVK